MKKTLQQALKGMKVKSWEIRESHDGRRTVYVRFTKCEPDTTVKVTEPTPDVI